MFAIVTRITPIITSSTDTAMTTKVRQRFSSCRTSKFSHVYVSGSRACSVACKRRHQLSKQRKANVRRYSRIVHITPLMSILSSKQHSAKSSAFSHVANAQTGPHSLPAMLRCPSTSQSIERASIRRVKEEVGSGHGRAPVALVILLTTKANVQIVKLSVHIFQ